MLSKRPVYQGHVIDVSVERVRMPNGHELDLDLVRHPGASAVVPIDAQGRVVLVHQMRHATGGFLYEIPAGKLDAGESPQACGARELQEETGMRAQHWQSLGAIWTTPGFCNERIHLFLATGLTTTQQALEIDELLSVEHMPFAEAVRRATQGEFTDAKTVCGLLRAAAAGARS